MISFAQIKLAIGLVAVLTIAALSWGIKHQTDQLIEARAARDSALAAAEQNARVVGEVQAQHEQAIADLAKLEARLSVAKQLSQAAIERLEEVKRNERMVQADPVNVQRLINDRMRSLFVDLSCASGRSGDDCAGSSAASGPVAPPGSPAPGPRPQ